MVIAIDPVIVPKRDYINFYTDNKPTEKDWNVISDWEREEILSFYRIFTGGFISMNY
eukprot:UN27102